MFATVSPSTPTTRTCVVLVVSVILIQIIHLCVCAPFKLIKLPSRENDNRQSLVIGCLYSQSLCNIEEYCADDSLLGVCLPLASRPPADSPAIPVKFFAPFEESAVPIDNEQPEVLDRRVFQLGKSKVVIVPESLADWSQDYVNCLKEYIRKHGSWSNTNAQPCQEYLRFPTQNTNENEVVNADDDPLRKYKNGPRINPRTSISGSRSREQPNTQKVDNEDLSSIPLLMIRGKNLPKYQPEVRVLRSADYFSDNDENDVEKISRRQTNYDDATYENAPEIEETETDYDSPYILVDDSENDESDSESDSEIKTPVLVLDDSDINVDSDKDYDKAYTKEWLGRLFQGSKPSEVKTVSESDPLFVIDLSPKNGEDMQQQPLSSVANDFNYELLGSNNEVKDDREDTKDTPIKIIDAKDDKEEEEESVKEKPQYKSETEDSQESEDSELPQQQETIYGTINYNNANDEEARRLSNFYRKHRYDIKKPGPKYMENYFFEDFLNKPKVEENSKKSIPDFENEEEELKPKNDDEPAENSMSGMLSSLSKSVPKSVPAEDRSPALIMNEANMRQSSDDAYDDEVNGNPTGSDSHEDNDEAKNNDADNQTGGKTLRLVLDSLGFGKKLVTEDPETEQTIRSSLPLSEGPVKVDAKLRNTLIIRKADQNEPTNLEAIDSTHTYVVMDKQITSDGSKLFIKKLEQVFRLPRGTFSNLRMEKQQITFKVNPNYMDLNASQVASRIEENAKLIRDLTGFWVQESGIGNRAKLPVTSRLLSERENQRLIHYTLLICSGILASLTATFVILAFRKNIKFREKVKGLMKNADDYIKTSEFSEKIRHHIRRDAPAKDSETTRKESVDDKTNKNKKIGTDQRSSSEGEKVVSPSSRSSTSSWSEEPVTSNMDIATGHLVLTYMEGHLKKKDRLDKEWEALCAYEVEPSATNAASQAQNASKNRSPDVLPYDHSRVILNDLVNASKSDYINANSITNSDPRNPAYIATQGPLTGTRADFWQMVWEQGSVCIVMLTRLRESGLSLCDRYWPEEGAETYQDYEVHLVSEHIWCDDFLVRSFYLKNLKTSETRTVTQFHFLSWPEGGLPPSTKALLDFRRKINKSYKGKSCPVIVHCSDGIGRTGTYILIDMVLNRLSKGAKEIDIAASLEHLRDQRIGMVKSKQQFEFVLLAVADEVQAILKSLAQN